MLIPPELAKVETLARIDLSENPRLHPKIVEHARQGPEKLLAYLRSPEYFDLYQAELPNDKDDDLDKDKKKK
jgi:hypothetical protein